MAPTTGLTWDLGYLIVIAALFATVMFMSYEKFCRADDSRCKGITMTFGVLGGLVALVVIGIAIFNARKGAKAPTRPYGNVGNYNMPRFQRPIGGYYRPGG